MTHPPIHEVRFYKIAGHRVGAILYGDTWAILNIHQHPKLLEQGLVFFHPTDVWDDKLEPVYFKDESQTLGSGMYRGAVIDDRVARLVQEMRELGRRREFDGDPRYMGAFDEWPDLWGEGEDEGD